MAEEAYREVLRRLANLEQGHQLLNQQQQMFQKEIRKELQENTKVTKEIADNTSDIVALFHNAKTGATWIIRLLNFSKWIGGIIVSIAAAIAAYTALRHGTFPNIKLPGE